MEGRKKERVMATAVCVLVILLSAQRLPVGLADPTSPFCQCYLGCFGFDPECSGEGWQRCHDYCCAIACRFPGDADFDRVCEGSGGQQTCGTEAPGYDTTSTTTADDAVVKANYWSGGHGKAKAKHG
ncbi:hypothetical protein CFC21_087058 [Triticum aestivum]|uniref:Uncharacterized protein n=2 Tax=Triticum aestivum TaxID=4565 RepID=A0A3B6PJ06_WHEAT|nr:uncharacterized protein LOC123138934 [Triticum aestivum]KAF7083250.1 hypothetical protein CFC21_087058 [Triticum aestivum]